MGKWLIAMQVHGQVIVDVVVVVVVVSYLSSGLHYSNDNSRNLQFVFL